MRAPGTGGACGVFAGTPTRSRRLGRSRGRSGGADFLLVGRDRWQSPGRSLGGRPGNADRGRRVLNRRAGFGTLRRRGGNRCGPGLRFGSGSGRGFGLQGGDSFGRKTHLLAQSGPYFGFFLANQTENTVDPPVMISISSFSRSTLKWRQACSMASSRFFPLKVLVSLMGSLENAPAGQPPAPARMGARLRSIRPFCA
jgi:hypothetical protein